MPEPADTNGGAVRASLAAALTFHASFDHGPDADFALGDGRHYSVTVENGQETGALLPGLGQPALRSAAGHGRFGSALQFTQDTSHVVLFKAAGNVADAPSNFGGTASFWMSGDPAVIPERYGDPFQLTDKDYSDACLWAEAGRLTRDRTLASRRMEVVACDVLDRAVPTCRQFQRLLLLRGFPRTS